MSNQHNAREVAQLLILHEDVREVQVVDEDDSSHVELTVRGVHISPGISETLADWNFAINAERSGVRLDKENGRNTSMVAYEMDDG